MLCWCWRIRDREAVGLRHLYIRGIGTLKVFNICTREGRNSTTWEGVLLGQDGMQLLRKISLEEIEDEYCWWDFPGPPAFGEENKNFKRLVCCREHNIRKCYGSVRDELLKRNSTLLILEWFPCTLNHLVRIDEFACSCTYEDLLRIFSGIANGLRYLHEEENMIRFDLNPDNVIMKGRTWPKLSEFGVRQNNLNDFINFSRDRDKTRYVAPEVLFCAQHPSWSHKMSHFVDIYSLGVLMFECVQRQELNDDLSCSSTDDNAIYMFLSDRPQWYRCNCPGPLHNLIRQCLRFDRGLFNTASHMCCSESYDRPDARSVLLRLEKMLHEPWRADAPEAWAQSLLLQKPMRPTHPLAHGDTESAINFDERQYM